MLNLVGVVFLATATVTTTVGVGYTNDNILHSHQYPPAEFGSMTVGEEYEVNGEMRIAQEGEFYGYLENGSYFTQTNVANDYTRMQRFQVDMAWWYIYDGGVIGKGEGLSPIQALSIYLYLSSKG